MKATATRFLSLTGIVLYLAACATTTGAKLKLTNDDRLVPCGAAPNCVSSDEAGGVHGIEALALSADPEAAWLALVAYVEGDKSYEVKVLEAGYLRAVARTRVLRFVDDVEFHLRPEAGQIAMRSASRLGFSDFGKNRRRLEAARQALSAAGVLATGS